MRNNPMGGLAILLALSDYCKGISGKLKNRMMCKFLRAA